MDEVIALRLGIGPSVDAYLYLTLATLTGATGGARWRPIPPPPPSPEMPPDLAEAFDLGAAWDVLEGWQYVEDEDQAE